MLRSTFETSFQRLRERSNGDALGLAVEDRQLLIELLGDERHHRVQGSETVFNTSEQHKSSRLLFFLSARCKHRLGGLEVHIAKFEEPEVVEGIGGFSEGVGLELVVHVSEHFVEFA